MQRHPMTRLALAAATWLLVQGLLLATAGVARAEQRPAAAGEPIRIGVLVPLSGIGAAAGKDATDGWNLWWQRHGRTVAGREIQSFIEDTAGNPDLGLSKARLLVEQRQVHMLVGTVFASVGLAVATYVEQVGIPTFYPIAAADDLTQRHRVPNLMRIAGWSSSQVTHPFGEWVATTTPCRRLVTLAADYAFGHEAVGGFVNTFTDVGGQVLEQIWHPIAETDFSPYLARLAATRPDCVFAMPVGAPIIRFIQAWHDLGLWGRIPLYVGEVVTDQAILRGIDPPDLVVGLISAGHWAEGRDDATTQEFVRLYEDAYRILPSYYAAAMYTAAQWLTRAITAANGRVEDRQAFLQTVRATQLQETPFGPARLDDYNHPIFNVYIREVVKRPDGRAWNVVRHTIPNVSQFYKYDPEAYLRQPVYSRQYQGINWP